MFNSVKLPRNMGVMEVHRGSDLEVGFIVMSLSLRLSSFGNIRAKKRSVSGFIVECSMLNEVKFFEKPSKKVVSECSSKMASSIPIKARDSRFGEAEIVAGSGAIQFESSSWTIRVKAEHRTLRLDSLSNQD